MSRVSKIWLLFLVLFSTLALIACSNIFNPDGEGDGGTAASDFLDAEKAFRYGDYDKAIELYQRMLKRDSTLSEGYYGIANANLWKSLVASQVVREKDTLHMWSKLIEVAQVAQKSPDSLVNILQDKAEFKNALWQGLKQISNNLATLTHRDTLTYYWELDQAYGDEELAKSSLSDGTKARYKQAVQIYRDPVDSVWYNLNPDGTRNKKKPFPLSDRKITLTAYSPVLAASETISPFLKFFDFNNDECITDKDFSRSVLKETYIGAAFVKKAGCLYPDSSKHGDDFKPPSIDFDGGLNAKDIYEELMPQEELEEMINNPDYVPETASQINDKIANLSTDADSILNVLESITSGVGGKLPGAPDLDSLKETNGSATEDIKDKLDTALNKYASFINFYKFGDRMDNDGDGCVDEEWIDGMDNDGDGLVDEDATLAPFDPTNTLLYGRDGIDNNLDNLKDDVLERLDLASDKIVIVDGDTTFIPLGWVTQATWTTGPYFGDKDTLLAIAKDGNGIKYPLPKRKEMIGGCWNNYDDTKFQAWIGKAVKVVWDEVQEN